MSNDIVPVIFFMRAIFGALMMAIYCVYKMMKDIEKKI